MVISGKNLTSDFSFSHTHVTVISSITFFTFHYPVKIHHLYTLITRVYLYNNVQKFFVPMVNQLIYSSIICALFLFSQTRVQIVIKFDFLDIFLSPLLDIVGLQVKIHEKIHIHSKIISTYLQTLTLQV